MSDLSKLILKKVIDDNKFCRRALPYLQADYFEGEYRIIYQLLMKYISEYNSRPSKPALEYEFGDSEFNVEINSGCIEVIDQIYTITDEEKSIDERWMLEQTEKWCKDRAIHNAILKSIGIIDGQDKRLSRGAIPDILNQALGVSFDQNIGHDYLDNAKERYEYYNRVENKIAFDLELMNKITKGGVSDGTLNVLMASCVRPDTKVKVRFRRKI